LLIQGPAGVHPMGRIRFEAFVAEPAATVQGLLAKLAYFDELAGEFETE
jgi:hypothetical protein